MAQRGVCLHQRRESFRVAKGFLPQPPPTRAGVTRLPPLVERVEVTETMHSHSLHNHRDTQLLEYRCHLQLPYQVDQQDLRQKERRRER